MASYASIAELKLQIDKEGASGVTSSTNLQLLLDAATTAIDNLCNEPDGFEALSTAVARVYPGSGQTFQWIDNCVTVTKVEVKASASDTGYVEWDAADYVAFRGDPEQPVFNSLSHKTPRPVEGLMLSGNGKRAVFTSGKFASLIGFPPDPDTFQQSGNISIPTVRVTAKWGYAVTLPNTIKQACIIQAARWFIRGSGTWADSTTNDEFGSSTYRKVIDPDIAMILSKGHYMRPVFG